MARPPAPPAGAVVRPPPPPAGAVTRPPAAPATAPAVAPAAAAPAGAPAEGPEFFASVELLSAAVDGMDYFQLFSLPPTASPAEIKKAYYRESRLYHPDRFNRLPDGEMREKIGKLFKRVTEAYVVLRDDKKRAKYVSDIAGPERERKLRYTEASEAEQKAEAKKAVEEQIGTTPKGRECYKNGVKEFEGKRYEAAIRQLKTALMYEPANARYKEKLKEIEDIFDKMRPKNDFKIK